MRFVLAIAVAACGGANKPPSDATPSEATPAPDPGCTESGCLRRLEKVGDFGAAELAPFLGAGVQIDNGYSVYTIEYATAGRTALATVAIPYGVASPEGGWHVDARDRGGDRRCHAQQLQLPARRRHADDRDAPGQPRGGDLRPRVPARVQQRTVGRVREFHEYFTNNRIGAYEQSAPLEIYQGDADTLVLRASTDGLVHTLRAGGVEVEYEVVPGGTHTDIAYGFVASAERRTPESITWLKTRLGE